MTTEKQLNAAPCSASVPRICGTCRKREPESGYCLVWCLPTDPSATCSHWMQEENETLNESAWLDRAIAWVESSSHKPWCNVAPGNIYASDGNPCDCGREMVLKDLEAARSNEKVSDRPE